MPNNQPGIPTIAPDDFDLITVICFDEFFGHYYALDDCSHWDSPHLWAQVPGCSGRIASCEMYSHHADGAKIMLDSGLICEQHANQVRDESAHDPWHTFRILSVAPHGRHRAAPFVWSPDRGYVGRHLSVMPDMPI